MTSTVVSQAGDGRPSMVSGWYLYGVVPPTVSVSEDLRGVGSRPQPLTVVRHGEVAALVSRVDEGRALGSRRDMLAHARVLNGLAATTAVLPARFGVVLPDRNTAIDELLASRQEAFASALNDLDGACQFTVTVRHVPEAVLREALVEQPDIAHLRELVVAGVAGPDARVRLGERVAQALAGKRTADADRVRSALVEYALACVDKAVGAEDEACSLALLAARDRQAPLEQAAQRLAGAWAGRAQVRLLGPLAPYDFVDALVQDKT